MKLSIQNMVCDRCIESVQNILREADVEYERLVLGEVETTGPISQSKLDILSDKLSKKGFSLIRDRETELVERMKTGLLDYLRELERNKKAEKLSVFMAGKLHYNYSYLSKIFSDNTGETLEGHLIKLKIERVKELLSYRSMTLSEIAWKLKYSSVQYLSNQFKKVTGKTVTEFLRQAESERVGLDKI